MKKIGIITGIILTAIIVGIIFIQGKEVETDVTKERTKVGVILIGNRDDASWNQSHYEGMEKIAVDLNLHVIYKENIPEDESSMAVMEELVEEGCKIIFCNSFGYGEWVKKAAKAYPDIYFFHATGTEIEENLSTYFGRIYQMRYLSGIVAGLQTETNKIGYVAAFPIDEVNRGINAFALGVRSVNQEAVVYVEWCNSWIGEEEAAKATKELLTDHNIDVLALHSNAHSPMQMAEEKGIWVIGYNADNSQQYPGSFLTAPVWQWEKFYGPRILECLQGKFKGQYYWEDADTGLVALAPLTENVKSGIVEIVEKERTRIESGVWDVFYGPIKDQNGNVRINDGESMTDDSMLNDFDWYVEGVILNGE